MAFIDGKFTFTDSEVSNQGSPCVGDTPWRQSFSVTWSRSRSFFWSKRRLWERLHRRFKAANTIASVRGCLVWPWQWMRPRQWQARLANVHGQKPGEKNLLELVATCLKGESGTRVQPQSDLNTLRSSASMVLKLDLVAELMTKLKLILPSEQTSHLVIRPLLALSLNEMPFHDCFKEFKRVFRLKTKGSWICWRMLRSWAWSQRPTTPRRPQTRKFFRTATLAQNHCKRKPRKKWKKNQPTKNSEHEEECGGTAGRA